MRAGPPAPHLTPARPLRTAALLAALFAAQAAFARWLTGGALLDDAYISMRYARHLADGFGPVYNPGEPPVEGYTNPLWVAALALGARLGADLPALTAALSLAAAALGVLAAARLAERLRPGAGPLAALALITTPAWVHLAALGLETAAFGAALAFAAAALLAGRLRRAGLLFLTLALLRPDGLLPWSVATFWLAVRPSVSMTNSGAAAATDHPGARDAAHRSALVPLVRFLWPAAPLYAVYFGARWAYYGELLPNTFAVKTGGGLDQLERGLRYLVTAGWESGLLLWAFGGILSYVTLARLPAAPVPVSVPPSPKVGRGTAFPQEGQGEGQSPPPATRSTPVVDRAAPRALLGALLLTYLAYIAAVGGDAFGPRFLAHILPLAAALAWSAAPRSALPRPARAALTAVMILPLAAGLGLYAMEITETRFTAAWAAAGQYLAVTAPPGATLAVDAAGALPYHSGLPTIDRLGLNDKVVAATPAAVGRGRPGHERFNDAYVLSRRPTWLGCWRQERERLTCDVAAGAALGDYRPALLVGVRARPSGPPLLAPPDVEDAAGAAAAWDRGYRYLLLQRIAGR